MPIDPGTALLVATAVGAAAKGTGDYLSGEQGKKAAKRRSKSYKRETHADLFQEALQRSVDLEKHRMASRQKIGKRKGQSMQDTADLVRGAFNI